MARQRINFRMITDSILAATKTHSGSYGMSQHELIRAVITDTGYTNESWIRGIIRTMVASKRLGGYINYQQNVSEITHREMADAGEESATLAAMREEIERYKAETAAAVKKAEETRALERIIEVHVKQNGKKTKKMKDIFHRQFAKILKLAEARMNIFIYGPTGCGKSYLVEQVAKALGLDFAFVSCTAGMSEGHLAGRLLPTGDQGTFEYIISEFIRLYESGGVFLVDEMDAADPNVLLIINAALANGQMAVPNRPEKPYAKRHPDFVCIAAANTVGTGADRMYSGRNKLDAATLDRFQIGKVHMDYDEEVEKQLCPNDNLRVRLLSYREAINAHRLERAMSTRFMKDAHRMTDKFGWDLDDVDSAYFEGWRDDEKAKVLEHVAQNN